MKITCGTCGKRYDSEQDELCPYCGAYNPFDKEDTARRLKTEAKESHRGHQEYGEDCSCPDDPDPQGQDQRSVPEKQPKPFTYRADDPTRNQPVKTFPIWPLTIVLIIALIVGKNAAVPILRTQKEAYFSGEDTSFLTVQEEETFQADGLRFTVLGMGKTELAGLERIWGVTVPEGEQILYVDVLVDNDSMEWKPGPNSLYLNVDGKLYKKSLSDWDAAEILERRGFAPMIPLMGFEPGQSETQFFFAVPGDAENFIFCMGEKEDHPLFGERIKTVYQVPLSTAVDLERGGEQA